ncbi:type IV pilus modification protein PilV [uncultured Acinetobacter sp.]|uniref:type IV pilus modification protein PilV n=1 Tax=uncultured Acinetobacter sp. TaxID=165433 RepID=UPI0026125157|nr:type IV pilus modification protein PilV [uncultured Acinetobacter sp.]
MNLHAQRGVGLIEVLVAMLILSVAILGFVALQVRATVATEEALKRSDALILLNGLAEKIRVNSSGNYRVSIPTALPSCATTQDCNVDQQAQLDLYQQQQVANSKTIQIGVDFCPNTSAQQQRLCLIAAWNETQPVIAARSVEHRCLNDNGSDNAVALDAGRYANDPDCLVLEAY